MFLAGAQLIAQQQKPFPEPDIEVATQCDLLRHESDSLSYIGNFPVLDRQSHRLEYALKQIAQRTRGSLFMVVRKRQAANDPFWFRLGPVRVGEDTARIFRGKVPLPLQNNTTQLLKFRYAGTSNGRHYGHHLAEDLEIAEVMYYQDVLDDHQARQVESYLALKYSVNITSDLGPYVCDYLFFDDEKVWNCASDRSYRKEVLALGRLEARNFYQTQSFTADGEAIAIALKEEIERGQMPEDSLRDSTLLVLAQQEPLPTKPGNPCDKAGEFQWIWKLMLHNWETRPSPIYIELDTLLARNVSLHLQDAGHRYPVFFQERRGKTQIKLFLPDTGLLTKNYFIGLSHNIPPCPTAVQIQAVDCGDTTAESSNSLLLHNVPENSRLEIVDIHSNNLVFSEAIPAGSGVVEPLPIGEYQVVIDSGNSIVASDLVQFQGSCHPGSEAAATNRPLHYRPGGKGQNAHAHRGHNPGQEAGFRKSGDQGSPISLRPQWLIYPNPARVGKDVYFDFSRSLQDELSLDVFDDKGAHLYSREVNCQEEPEIIEKFFSKGVYHIRLSYTGGVEYFKLIIN